jgi:hypothetical protein
MFPPCHVSRTSSENSYDHPVIATGVLLTLAVLILLAVRFTQGLLMADLGSLVSTSIRCHRKEMGDSIESHGP